MSNATYEFTTEQNIIVAQLASRMTFVGRALVCVAVLLSAWAILASPSSGALALEAGIILGLTGFWSDRAGAALRRVVSTQGADLAHLMRAMGEIRKLYELQFWFFILLAALIVTTLAVAIVGHGRFPAAW